MKIQEFIIFVLFLILEILVLMMLRLKKRDNMITTQDLFVTFIVLKFLDLLTTIIGYSFGLLELNPFGFFYVIFFSVLTIFFSLFLLIDGKVFYRERFIARLSLYIFSFILLVIVLNNSYLIGSVLLGVF